MSFQNIIVGVAILILIISLIVIGILIRRNKSNVKYPPIVSECPDYFEIVGPNKCKNTQKLGKCKKNGTVTETYDFSSGRFSGPSGQKNKCRLAAFCDITWDGIDKLC